MTRKTSVPHPIATADAVRAALVEAMTAEHAVVAGYMFGSIARGDAGPLSDIDVALLVRDRHEAESSRARVMDALSRTLRTSRIDVTLLGDAPLPLRYRVVRDGLLVLCRDAAAVERFVVDTVLQYLDFKPVRDRAFERMREAILERR